MQHFIPQTKQAAVEFGPLKQHIEGRQFDGMRMWNCRFVNGCICNKLISTEILF